MTTTVERQCAACGAAVGGGPFCEKCGADHKALSFEQDRAWMLHSGPLRSARGSLLWVGVLTAIGALLMFARSNGEDFVAFVIGLGVAVLYVGLWQWAKREALGATAAGLGVFVTLQVAGAAIEPASLLQGIILKVVVLVLLVRGVRAGVVLRSHGADHL
jgi:hypothetical protein